MFLLGLQQCPVRSVRVRVSHRQQGQRTLIHLSASTLLSFRSRQPSIAAIDENLLLTENCLIPPRFLLMAFSFYTRERLQVVSTWKRWRARVREGGSNCINAVIAFAWQQLMQRMGTQSLIYRVCSRCMLWLCVCLLLEAFSFIIPFQQRRCVQHIFSQFQLKFILVYVIKWKQTTTIRICSNYIVF